MKKTKNVLGWTAIVGAALLPGAILATSFNYYDFETPGHGWFGVYYPPYSADPVIAVGDSAYWSSYQSGIALVGSNVSAYGSDSMIVGKWNPYSAGNEVFAVGNGTSGAPSNAFEILEDGTVRIGDIQNGYGLGEFGE